MITKEELLEKLLETRIGDKHRAVLKLALKGLEYEKIEGQEFIPLGEHLLVVGGLTRSRNFWRKKYDELADELDDKIIALEEKLKAKDASLAEAFKIIDDARAKHRDLEIQTAHLRNGRKKAEDQIGVLEDKLRDTVSLQYHDELVESARRRITALLIERDAFAEEIKKWEEAHRAKNADIDKLFTENKELDDLKRENGVKALLIAHYKSHRDVWQQRCSKLKVERDKLEADLRFLLGQ